MPGKQPRSDEPPLSRRQANIARSILLRHVDPAEPAKLDEELRAQLLSAINQAFLAQRLPPTYSLRKMEDWRANTIYRYQCKQRCEGGSAAPRGVKRQGDRSQQQPQQKQHRHQQHQQQVQQMTRVTPSIIGTVDQQETVPMLGRRTRCTVLATQPLWTAIDPSMVTEAAELLARVAVPAGATTRAPRWPDARSRDGSAKRSVDEGDNHGSMQPTRQHNAEWKIEICTTNSGRSATTIQGDLRSQPTDATRVASCTTRTRWVMAVPQELWDTTVE